MGSGSSHEIINEDMHVVIIGGGFGGFALAHRLITKNVCKVTLVDPKDSYVHWIGSLRASVEKDYTKKIFIPYAESSVKDSFVRGTAQDIDPESKTVTLTDGNTLSYTHLVIATGGSSPFPGKIGSDNPDVTKEKGIEIYHDYHQELTKGKNFVVVGAGAVGLEMAGELKTTFPDSKVTIVSSSEVLGSKRLNKTALKRLRSSLEKLDIELVLNDRLNLGDYDVNKHVPDQKVTTQNGKELDADFIIPCVGVTVNTEFCKKSLGAAMTSSGLINVNEYLQVTGHNNVYAIGDVTSLEEEKAAINADKHVSLLVTNFTRLAKKETSCLSKYKPGPFIMVIPLGKNGGVAQFPFGITAGDAVSKKVKSGDLFVTKTWSDFGLDVSNA